MPIRGFLSFAAMLIAAQCLAVGALPGPFALMFLGLCVSSVTLLAWIATDGQRPTLVVGAAMVLAFFAAHGQPEFLAAAACAALTGGILLFKTRGRECAESSQP
jgi:hypothetical protein